MPEVILPCPNPKCGSTNVYVRGRSNAQVTCRSCGMEGPEFCGPNQVIAAWNALPRALTWTNDPPKVAGAYYTRDTRYPEEAGIVQITSQQAERLTKKGASPFIQYAGPIPEPID